MELMTIGYGGRPPAEFVSLLAAAGVRTVVDVRLRPDKASLGSYSRAKSPEKGIEKLLTDAGIGYRSLIELGNVFLGLDDWPERYQRLLDAAGGLLVERLLEVPGPACLLCAEKRPAECHRTQIAEFLAKTRGWRVTHLE